MVLVILLDHLSLDKRFMFPLFRCLGIRFFRVHTVFLAKRLQFDIVSFLLAFLVFFGVLFTISLCTLPVDIVMGPSDLLYYISCVLML